MEGSERLCGGRAYRVNGVCYSPGVVAHARGAGLAEHPQRERTERGSQDDVAVGHRAAGRLRRPHGGALDHGSSWPRRGRVLAEARRLVRKCARAGLLRAPRSGSAPHAPLRP